MAWVTVAVLVLAILLFLYRRWSALNEQGLVAREEEAKRVIAEAARKRLENEAARLRAQEREKDVTDAGKAVSDGTAADFLREAWGGPSSDDAN